MGGAWEGTTWEGRRKRRWESEWCNAELCAAVCVKRASSSGLLRVNLGLVVCNINSYSFNDRRRALNRPPPPVSLREGLKKRDPHDTKNSNRLITARVQGLMF